MKSVKGAVIPGACPLKVHGAQCTVNRRPDGILMSRVAGAAQYGPKGSVGTGGDEDHRPQDAVRLRTIQCHQRRGPACPLFLKLDGDIPAALGAVMEPGPSDTARIRSFPDR